MCVLIYADHISYLPLFLSRHICVQIFAFGGYALLWVVVMHFYGFFSGFTLLPSSFVVYRIWCKRSFAGVLSIMFSCRSLERLFLDLGLVNLFVLIVYMNFLLDRKQWLRFFYLLEKVLEILVKLWNCIVSSSWYEVWTSSLNLRYCYLYRNSWYECLK